MLFELDWGQGGEDESYLFRVFIEHLPPAQFCVRQKWKKKTHKESMRHDPCHKGARSAVLALEQSKTVLVVYIAEISAGPSLALY